jgi:hypothetical protein
MPLDSEESTDADEIGDAGATVDGGDTASDNFTGTVEELVDLLSDFLEL